MNQRTRAAWMFLAPMLCLMLFVAGWPLARSIWFSFTDTNLNNLAEYHYVGLDNYFSEYGLFGNSIFSAEFWETDWGVSIKNTFQFSIVSVTLETIAGLGVAMLLNQDFKGRTMVRTAVLVPWAIPTIVSAKMWGWILHDQFGLVNQLLIDWGLIAKKIAFTADPSYALLTVVAVDVWKTTPFMALLILAALLRGGPCRRGAPATGVLESHATADSSGAAGSGGISHARCITHLRPDLCIDLQQRQHHQHVGFCTPRHGGQRQPGFRLGWRDFADADHLCCRSAVPASDPRQTQ
jgi:ABC-type spermidine/putrescine transport system permease subunit II